MSEATFEKFSCDSCSRTYYWKEQLAGKRVKCKCGSVMTVPAALKAENSDFGPDVDGGFDLDALANADAKAVDRTANNASDLRIIPMAMPAVKARPAGAGGAGTPIGYQAGKTAAQLKREAELTGHLKDTARDIYAPLAVLLAGVGLYIGNLAYITHGAGIPAISVGVSIVTAIQAILLIAFALCVAGPLGVSFGHPLTAALKLAAIAAFSDGVTSWIGMWIAHMAAGMSYPITIPISTAIYWIGLIQLFNMDGGDSWLVVIILSIVDRVLLGIILLILGSVLLGSAGNASTVGIGGAASGSKHVSETAELVDQLKEGKQWEEARACIADGHQSSMAGMVDAMYAAGAKQIGFEVDRDINGHGSPSTLYVELPASKDGRNKIRQLRYDYMKANEMGSDPTDLVDDPKEDYLTMGVR